MLFAIGLTLPLLNGFLHIKRFEVKEENRVFAQMPEADINHLDDYPKAFESYFNDNFSFRSPMLDLIHKIKYFGFSVSPHPEQDAVGTDGFCFLTTKEKEIYEGNLDFTQGQLDSLEVLWRNRMQYFNSRGMKCYWLVVPAKHQVYSDKLPLNFAKGSGPLGFGTSRIDQIEKHMSTRFPGLLVNPLPALLAEKKKRKLFYKLDSHWNFSGGLIGTRTLMTAIHKDFPQVKPVDFKDFIWKDTISDKGFDKNLLGIKSLCEPEQIARYKKEFALPTDKYNFPPTEGFPYPWDYELRYKRVPSDSALPKLLVIRDSFGNQMFPFLKEGFNESIFIWDAWKFQVDKNIIETYNPGIIVYVTLQSHLENMIKPENFTKEMNELKTDKR